MKVLRSLCALTPGLVVLAVAVGLVSGLGTTAVVSRVEAAIAEPEGRDGIAPVTFALIAIGVVAAGAVSQRVTIRLAQRTVFAVRLSLARAILDLPLADVERLGGPRLLACLTQDAGRVSAAIVALPLVLSNLAVVGGLLLYLVSLSWPLACLTAAVVVVGITTYRLPANRARQALATAREHEDGLFHGFDALTSGIQELQFGHRRRAAFQAHLVELAARHRGAATRGLTLYATAWSWGQLLFLALLGSILFGAPHLIDLDDRTLAGFTLGILYLGAPLATIVSSAPAVSNARVALEKIDLLGFDIRRSGDPSGPPDPGPGTARRVELEGVAYEYGGEDRFLLGPIDLAVAAPAIVFLTGGNGSGKTTLAKILAGLYEPSSGRMLVDGRAVAGRAAASAHRERVSLVLADPFVFESLLGLGDGPGASGRAGTLLAELRLGSKVRIDEHGRLSTTALSVGQRKRLALLAALLEDRQIVILDEWAAEQDAESRRWFYETLLPRLRAAGKLVIVVTHDASYFHVADRLVGLDLGRVTHDTLPGGTEPEPPALASAAEGSPGRAP